MTRIAAADGTGGAPERSELDLRRLTDLQRVLGSTVPEIIAQLVAELDRAIGDAHSALASGDLPQVAQAAHAARNSALMLDAQPTLAALGAVEAGARSGDADAVRAGTEELDTVWPALRRRLEQAAASAAD